MPLLVAWLLLVLNKQHHTSTIGAANNSFRNVFNKAKADLVVKNSQSLWTFMTTKVIGTLGLRLFGFR